MDKNDKKSALEMGTDVPLKKYYTAFVLWAQDSVSDQTLQLHCTHKYLGEQDPYAMGAVVRITKKFFDKPHKWPLAVFKERGTFNECTCEPSAGGLIDPQTDTREPCPTCAAGLKPVSVLKSFISGDNFFPELKAELDGFREDDYTEYMPHITVDNYPSITGMFQCYAVMSGQSIISYWRNPEWAAQEKAAQRRAGIKVVPNMQAGQELLRKEKSNQPR